jgi:hypothetical protein
MIDMFAEREAAFNKSIGGTMANFAMAAVIADSAAKDANIVRILELLERPNIDMSATTSLVGLDSNLETRINVPVVAISPINPLIVDNAHIVMDMSVSAHQSDTLNLKSDTTVSATASFGIGLFKISGTLTANVSVAKEQKRSSDYSATTHAELTLKQGDVPEGLAKIIDAMNSTVQKGLQLNEQLISKQAEKLSDEMDKNELPPLPANVPANAPATPAAANPAPAN